MGRLFLTTNGKWGIMVMENNELRRIYKFTGDFTAYQFYRESDEFDVNQEISMLEKPLAYLLLLNALRKNLSGLQWRCGECKNCGMSTCPNALEISLQGPEVWQNWRPPSHAQLKAVLVIYKKALYTATLKNLSYTLLNSGFKDEQLQHAETIMREAHQLYDKVMPEFFKTLDSNTEYQETSAIDGSPEAVGA
jgi:hypothetical protein